MRKHIIYLFLFFSFCAFSQTKKPVKQISVIYKTFQDSVFEVGDIIRFPDLIFTLDKAVLLPASEDSLKKLCWFFKKFNFVLFEIGNHTDTRGSDKHNTDLSKMRARIVAEFIVQSCGTDPKKITYKGYGESKPLIPDVEIERRKTKQEKEVGHARNRRTELKILSLN